MAAVGHPSAGWASWSDAWRRSNGVAGERTAISLASSGKGGGSTAAVGTGAFAALARAAASSLSGAVFAIACGTQDAAKSSIGSPSIDRSNIRGAPLVKRVPSYRAMVGEWLTRAEGQGGAPGTRHAIEFFTETR